MTFNTIGSVHTMYDGVRVYCGATYMDMKYTLTPSQERAYAHMCASSETANVLQLKLICIHNIQSVWSVNTECLLEMMCMVN